MTLLTFITPMGIDINWLAVVIATVANMVLGYLWYSVLFKNAWAKIVGLSDEQMKPAAGPLVFMAVLSFVTSYAVAYFFNFMTYDYELVNGIRLATELSVGILLPVILSINMFQRKPLMLTVIDWGYRFVGLAVIGLIIGGMGI